MMVRMLGMDGGMNCSGRGCGRGGVHCVVALNWCMKLKCCGGGGGDFCVLVWYEYQ